MSPEESNTLREQIESLLPFVASLLAYPWSDPPIDGWLTGGTALFVCSHSGQFLVTADHVVREIEQLRENQRVALLLGGVGAPPEEISDWEVIDRDSLLDVCTLKIPDRFSLTDINKQHFQVRSWPIPIAAVGDRAIIVGYPAAHRTAHANTINARCLPIQDFVTDVGPRRFTIADELETREVVVNPDAMTFPPHLGGMSGSPVFRVHDGDKPALLGFFSEGSDGMRGAYFCSHAHFLKPDGSIDRSRLPPM
jgi:hypothetical protein